jgi:hypothetical protein
MQGVPEREFWLRLARRATGVLAASRDNHIRFLWVDDFDTGRGNVSVDLGRRMVTARARVYGGKITDYLATLYLSPSGVENWRNGRWANLLPAEHEVDWLSISTRDGRMEIRLGGA